LRQHRQHRQLGQRLCPATAAMLDPLARVGHVTTFCERAIRISVGQPRDDTAIRQSWQRPYVILVSVATSPYPAYGRYSSWLTPADRLTQNADEATVPTQKRLFNFRERGPSYVTIGHLRPRGRAFACELRAGHAVGLAVRLTGDIRSHRSRSTWTGSASDLLRAGAAGRLRRAQTFLRVLGTHIAVSREGRAGTREIRIHTRPEDTVSTVSVRHNDHDPGSNERPPGPVGAARDDSHRPGVRAADEADGADAKTALHFG
jgi:hypothetical protein